MGRTRVLCCHKGCPAVAMSRRSRAPSVSLKLGRVCPSKSSKSKRECATERSFTTNSYRKRRTRLPQQPSCAMRRRSSRRSAVACRSGTSPPRRLRRTRTSKSASAAWTASASALVMTTEPTVATTPTATATTRARSAVTAATRMMSSRSHQTMMPHTTARLWEPNLKRVCSMVAGAVKTGIVHRPVAVAVDAGVDVGVDVAIVVRVAVAVTGQQNAPAPTVVTAAARVLRRRVANGDGERRLLCVVRRHRGAGKCLQGGGNEWRKCARMPCMCAVCGCNAAKVAHRTTTSAINTLTSLRQTKLYKLIGVYWCPICMTKLGMQREISRGLRTIIRQPPGARHI
eukprot:Opistho-2@13427